MNLKLGLPVGAGRQRAQRVLSPFVEPFPPKLLGLCCRGLLAFRGIEGSLPALAGLKLILYLLLFKFKAELVDSAFLAPDRGFLDLGIFDSSYDCWTWRRQAIRARGWGGGCKLGLLFLHEARRGGHAFARQALDLAHWDAPLASRTLFSLDQAAFTELPEMVRRYSQLRGGLADSERRFFVAHVFYPT
jgi:hypothetical protein